MKIFTNHLLQNIWDCLVILWVLWGVLKEELRDVPCEWSDKRYTYYIFGGAFVMAYMAFFQQRFFDFDNPTWYWAWLWCFGTMALRDSAECMLCVRTLIVHSVWCGLISTTAGGMCWSSLCVGLAIAIIGAIGMFFQAINQADCVILIAHSTMMPFEIYVWHIAISAMVGLVLCFLTSRRFVPFAPCAYVSSLCLHVL